MVSIPQEKLHRLIARWEALQTQLASGLDHETFVKLSKEFAELDPLVAAIKSLQGAQHERDSLRQMIEDPASEPDMAELAREELETVAPRVDQLEHDLQIMLLPKDAADEKSAILEVRAGTGGEEAALFAADLFRMYQRYADLKGWKVQVLSASDADAGGYKEIVAGISGKGVFARMKFESGVHRVQRVPETENQGRIHTSAATVAVLPEAEDIDIEIRDAGHPYRHHAGERGWRPAREHDGLGRAHYTHSDRHHRHLERKVSASEPRESHASAPREALRYGANEGCRGSRGGTEGSDRVGRPLAAH